MKPDTALPALSAKKQTKTDESSYLSHHLIEILLYNPELDALKVALPLAESTQLSANMKGKVSKTTGQHKHYK